MPEHEKTTLIPAVAKDLRKSANSIRDELEAIREQGYAISHGERLSGVTAISAPIFDMNDEVHFCLSVGGPSFRMQANENELIKRVVETAGTISYQYGGKLKLVPADEDDTDTLGASNGPLGQIAGLPPLACSQG